MSSFAQAEACVAASSASPAEPTGNTRFAPAEMYGESAFDASVRCGWKDLLALSRGVMVATSPCGIAMKSLDFSEVVTRQRLPWSFQWESWPRVKRPWCQGSQEGQAHSITWQKSFRVQRIRISVE